VSWFQVFLILHILAVVIGFGPDFAFPLIGSMGQKNPQHAAFAAEITVAIEEKVTLPLSILIPLFGTGLIYTGHYDLWKSEWLIIAVFLYVVVWSFATFVQTPNGRKLRDMLRDMEGRMPAGGPPPVTGSEQGPPPEFLAQVKRVQMGGAFLGLMVVFFVVLMIWKPGSAFTG
jgi:uncharacterized membrane protein